MGHGHGDGHGHGLVSAAGRHQRPLLVAFTLTLAMEIAPPEVDVAAVEQRALRP